LADQIGQLIADPQTLATIGANAHAQGQRHRGDSLIDLIVEVADR
jgi:hypothetical protein